MDFDNDERLVPGKELRSSTKNFVFSAFHIDLQQPRCGAALSDEVVESDRGHTEQFSTRQHGASTIGFHAAMRPSRTTSAKNNPARSVGPDR